MFYIYNHDDLSAWHQAKKERWALVPTMGNLHAGHLSLVRYAQQLADKVMVSIFVNPTQFGANEDFADYPRTLAADEALLREVGADALFLPDEKMIYPFGTSACCGVTAPAAFANILCGAHRPGHFDGVLNVVTRLFHLIRPEVAVFGEKDYQQQWLIKYCAADLHQQLDIHTAPTVRAADGLALSSRNAYLNPEARRLASQLYAHLQRQKEALRNGIYDVSSSKNSLEYQGFKLDYLELRRSSNLRLIEVDELEEALQAGDARLFIAARLGHTRLIDNLELTK